MSYVIGRDDSIVFGCCEHRHRDRPRQLARILLHHYTVIMVKKMVYLEPEQDAIVKRLARVAKTSETEVIRRAIAAYGDANAAKNRR